MTEYVEKVQEVVDEYPELEDVSQSAMEALTNAIIKEEAAVMRDILKEDVEEVEEHPNTLLEEDLHKEFGDNYYCKYYSATLEPHEIKDDGSCPWCSAQVEPYNG